MIKALLDISYIVFSVFVMLNTESTQPVTEAIIHDKAFIVGLLLLAGYFVIVPIFEKVIFWYTKQV